MAGSMREEEGEVRQIRKVREEQKTENPYKYDLACCATLLGVCRTFRKQTVFSMLAFCFLSIIYLWMREIKGDRDRQ